jgi:hypothetical protein
MFGGDPFGNPFEQMHRQMRQMDNMMNAMMQDSFGGFFGMPQQRFPQQQMIDDGRNAGRQRGGNGAVQQRRDLNDDMMMSPFGNFGFGGGLFGGLMSQMNNLQEHAMNDPNAVVFTQSTMISHDGTGAPRVVQSSTRKAGEVKETRRQVKHGYEDEEITVGHSIGDRTHVIEKKRDKDGRMRSQQKFINLDSDEAERFNEEFKSRAAEGLGVSGRRSGSRQQAIENGSKHRRGGGGTSGRAGGESSASNGPIVEIPDDDDDEIVEIPVGRKNRSNGRGSDRYYSSTNGGPTIREISEEEADMSVPKRRKGLLGKFFNVNE